ncbi:MAG: hypothetical protein QGI10_03830 [Vicinamibacterales bacterium]|jgi:hypothetical protein|nr:hypothetical protein [Vicinamibacterales bacterium]MDP7692993.1 hypothetical protein [Vicinamibacterales bacterium]HJN44495.1 hypothetical protein [Vicinamibacterales bacterium]
MVKRDVESVLRSGVILVALAIFGAPPAQAQLDRSHCADCHFANPYTEPAQAHLEEWSRSPHGRNVVGCEQCHGGNPDTFESLQAHRDVLGSLNPSSAVHRTQLPSTCGACHIGPYVAFQRSQHFQLLGEGDRRVPTGSTCHGSVGAHLLSPAGLERQCASCHGSDGVAPRPGRAAGARLLLEGVAEVRESLEAAETLIDRIRDPVRRAGLEAAAQQAEVPVIQARQAGHRFVFDQLEERLATARARTAELLAQLVNPSP